MMAEYRFPNEWMKGDMVLEPGVTPETLKKIESFELKEGDILIATYPKTGKV